LKRQNVRISRILPLGAIVATGLYLVGCGKPSEPAGGNGAAAGKEFKVALLTPGDINDQGWNQLAYEGLQGVEKELSAKISHQVVKQSDHQSALRDLGDQGYSLIICHGSEFEAAVKVVAPQFLDTKFVINAGDLKQEPNVSTLIPKLEEATYLVGMAAGGMSKSKTVGLVGGMSLNVIKSTFDAFTLGAIATNPQFGNPTKPTEADPKRLLINYVGTFDDQNAGKEAANAMIAKGADVLFHNADQAGKGMFDAAKAAKGVYVFGSNRNQNEVAPEHCVASAVINMPHAFIELARSVKDGKFVVEKHELNLKNGNIMVEWNAALKSKVPADVMKKIDQAAADIKSGKLKIKRNV